jgi:uncharacterized membrane protein
MASPSKSRARWWVPAALVVLLVVPIGAGIRRLVELGGGAAVTPDNARFFAAPVPVVLHIVSVTLFCVLGALQFAPAFRRRNPGWHRQAGRVLVGSGLAAALTGLWMSLFYPPVPGDGALLLVFRLLFGSLMAVCVFLGFTAIRRRDIASHRAWMLRGYAIALGAGTQAAVHLLFWVPWFGQPGVLARALLMGAGWAINLAVAEWWLRARGARGASRRYRSDGLMPNCLRNAAANLLGFE